MGMIKTNVYILLAAFYCAVCSILILLLHLGDIASIDGHRGNTETCFSRALQRCAEGELNLVGGVGDGDIDGGAELGLRIAVRSTNAESMETSALIMRLSPYHVVVDGKVCGLTLPVIHEVASCDNAKLGVGREVGVDLLDSLFLVTIRTFNSKHRKTSTCKGGSRYPASLLVSVGKRLELEHGRGRVSKDILTEEGPLRNAANDNLVSMNGAREDIGCAESVLAQRDDVFVRLGTVGIHRDGEVTVRVNAKAVGLSTSTNEDTGSLIRLVAADIQLSDFEPHVFYTKNGESVRG